MEAGLAVIQPLTDAPARTSQSIALVRSSPLPLRVREMMEHREFGRRYDTIDQDTTSLTPALPGLACPQGHVEFLADDTSFADFTLSVDGLLQHRKSLLAPQLRAEHPRRHALIIGAGPGGLMSAVQLSLRNHLVVVCEQREAYSRNRYIGVYKEVTHLMAALGMPESMTYDFSQYRGKRGIMLADIQTFLHGIALKLGVIIYSGAVVRNLEAHSLQRGEVELQRATRAGAGVAAPGSAIGMTRWHHDTVARVRSGLTIRFDTIIEASGGRSGLRELCVGPENIVSMRTLARTAAASDPSLESFFSNPDDHCAEYVESSYGCPPGLRKPFGTALLSEDQGAIPDELPCFVSNIDASVFTRPLTATAESAGLASRIGDRTLDIPHDWVVLECRLSDQSRSRYHIEGPLPQHFQFGGQQMLTRDTLDTLNPVGLLLRILYAMGVPFDAVDRRRLIEFYFTESSHADAADIVSTWVGKFRTLRLGGEKPIWYGTVPGSARVEYAIIGEALQNAWYRFGVGVDDTFAAAVRFAEGLELDPAARRAEGRRLEREMTARSVQVLYHLYGVAHNTEQGVVGAVLTEYQMDEHRSADLVEGRLRELAREAAEIAATEGDLRGVHPLLDAAIDLHRENGCRRAFTLLDSLPYASTSLQRAREPMKVAAPNWRMLAYETLDAILSPTHRELMRPLFLGDHAPPGGRSRVERLEELALGRYAWATSWIRACALLALTTAAPGERVTLDRAAGDPDPLVAETAAGLLAKADSPDGATDQSARLLTIDKVVTLSEVNLFKAIPHEVLARVAQLTTEQWVAPKTQIIGKGELGNSLFVIVSGRVEVHDGNCRLQELGARQSFGELALLDEKPRSAAVTAIEATRLLRLGQSDFYALLTERPDLLRAINRVLCEMVRGANALHTQTAETPA